VYLTNQSQANQTLVAFPEPAIQSYCGSRPPVIAASRTAS
jgi:hypothetical protein